MKVEFLQNEIYGATLFVSATEFLKGKDKGLEFDSLCYAVQAFAKYFGVDYIISSDEYDAVTTFLDKSGAVIFTIEDGDDGRSWCQITVSNDNKPTKVAYEDETGRHFRQHAEFNPKAMKHIKEKHNTGSK